MSLLATVVACLAASRLASGAASCAPTASVEGPAVIVRSVTEILRGHGVEPGPSSCGREDVRAVLSDMASPGAHPGATAYLLRMEDRFGRSTEREIRSPATAASLIESWAVGEDSDLIAPRAAPSAESGPAPAAATSPPRAGPWVSASGEISSTSDGLTWYGGSGSGCFTVRVLCVGARATYAHATGSLDSFPLPGVQLIRAMAGGLALVALPLRTRRMSLWPILGLGAAWMRTEASLAQFSASVDDAVLLADGALVAQISIAGGWSALAELGATWEPSLSGHDAQTPAAFLPSPPSRFLRAGLGIGFSP